MYNFIIGPTDTDSISFSKLDGSEFTKEERKLLVQELNKISPDFMVWDDDGLYRRCIAIKAKNYVLQKYKEDLKPGEKELLIKGAALKASNREPALKEMLQEIINALITDKDENYIVNIYTKYVLEASNIKDIKRWSVKKTITDKILSGERKNESKVRDAIGDKIVQEGDKLYVYSAIEGEIQEIKKDELVFYKNGEPKMIPNYVLKQIELWDGKNQNSEHYIERVYKTIEILKTILDINSYPNYSLKRNKKLLEDIINANGHKIEKND